MGQQHVRFERLFLLGSGSRTVTEKARLGKGHSTGRVVTLVRLLPLAEADSNARARFVGKGRVLMRLDEQAAVTALEIGRARTHYLAREFVDGLSLRTLLMRTRERQTRLPLALACDLVLQLCTNVMAMRSALRKTAPMFAQSSFAGTLRALVISLEGGLSWVDPFGLDDPALPLSASADPAREEIETLGGLLYELSVLREPPRREETLEFKRVAPSRFRPDVPAELDAVCGRALGFEASPLHGIGELVDALAEASADLPPPPPGWLKSLAGPLDSIGARDEVGPAGFRPRTRSDEETPASPVIEVPHEAYRTPLPGPLRPLSARSQVSFVDDQTPARSMSWPMDQPPAESSPPGSAPPSASAESPAAAAPLPPAPAWPRPLSWPPDLPGSAGSAPAWLPPPLWPPAQTRPTATTPPQVAEPGPRELSLQVEPARAVPAIVENVRQTERMRSLHFLTSGRLVILIAAGLVAFTTVVLMFRFRTVPPDRVVAQETSPASAPPAEEPTAAVAPIPPPPAPAPPARRRRAVRKADDVPAVPVESSAPPVAQGEPNAPRPAEQPADEQPTDEASTDTPATSTEMHEPAWLHAQQAGESAPSAPATTGSPSAPRTLELQYGPYVASHRIAGVDPRLPAGSPLAEGAAQVRICVDAAGVVNEIQIVSATAGVDELVRSAVRGWRYRPFTLRGTPLPACFSASFVLKRPE